MVKNYALDVTFFVLQIQLLYTMAKGKTAGAKKGGSARRKVPEVEAPREEEEVQSPGEEEFDTPQEEVEGGEGVEEEELEQEMEQELEQGTSAIAPKPKKSKAVNLTKVS